MESDLWLRRLERTAVAICSIAAVSALLLARGRPEPAIAVVAGGVLIGLSYWTIKGGVSGMMALAGRDAASDPRPRNSRRIVMKLAGRYALLALLAYVMIARLRLHPLGLLVGVSSVVAAVSVEAVRLLVNKS